MKKGKDKKPTFHNVRIEAAVYEDVKEYCTRRKVKIGGFFSLAALEKLMNCDKQH